MSRHRRAWRDWSDSSEETAALAAEEEKKRKRAEKFGIATNGSDEPVSDIVQPIAGLCRADDRTLRRLRSR